MTSPSVHKKVVKPDDSAVFSVKPKESPTSPPTKSKRATSFIKKKPRLERGLSDQSVLRLNRNVHLGMSRGLSRCESCSTMFLPLSDVNSSTSTADVSILGQCGVVAIPYYQVSNFPILPVTEPSPEVPIGPNINANQPLIHHVIVHRESEEYQTDYDDVCDSTRKSKLTQSMIFPKTLRPN